MQDNDLHHGYPDFNFFYVFLILAPILVAAIIYGGVKLMKYLDKRKVDKRIKNR